MFQLVEIDRRSLHNVQTCAPMGEGKRIPGNGAGVAMEGDDELDGIVRRFRRLRGLKQKELAAQVGISGSALSAIERGDTQEPTREHVIALDEALEADGEILTYYGFKQPSDAGTAALLQELLAQFGQLQNDVAALTRRLDAAGRERQLLARRLDRLEREQRDS